MARNTDYSLVSQSRRLEVLAAIRRLHAELDAMETDVLAAIAADPFPYPGEPAASAKQWIREDVACVLRIPSVTAGHKLDVATEIVARFPATRDAMWDARITGRYAERLVDAAADLPAEPAGKVEKQVLSRAGSQTLAQFGQSVRRAVAAADTRTAEAKHAAARDERRVVITAADNGMSELWALLPAEQAAAIQIRLQSVADAEKGIDERTADQRRADALHALITGASDLPGAGVAATVNVTVSLATLLGVDDQPAELDDHGSIPAGVARRIAFGPNTTWRRLLVDARGQVADVGSPTYRPPAPMARYVRLRDRSCQFPGCRRQAGRTELDHVAPWATGGRTNPDNLICLCSRHHHLKHDGGWQLRRAADKATHWASPTGQSFTRPPPEPPPF